MPMYDLICNNGHESIDVFVHGVEKPSCPLCGATQQTLWRGHATAIIPDDIPGGVEIKHGICNDDGTPRRFYSKSEMARAAKNKGLVHHVEHVTGLGTDKSKHTVRWV